MSSAVRARDVEAEHVQGVVEFQAASTDPWMIRLTQRDRRVVGDRRAGLRHGRDRPR